MHLKRIILALIPFIGTVLGQAAWTEDETVIIYQKIKALYTSNIKGQMKKLGFNKNDYTKGTNDARPAKVLRLAFHDCVPYADGGNVNGCDGCLNNKGMETDMLADFNTDQALKNGPDVTNTDNNGLLFTADMLELVYTVKEFPSQAPALAQSMKESGKSRADLWAFFAAMVAVQWGAHQNNLACKIPYKSKQCGHSRFDQDDCEIDLSALTSFQTGRSDCTPDSTLKRPFFTTKEEIHPNLHGNGPSTVDFFKDHFGLTAREAAALVEGAHSFGKFHEEVSMHKYMWTRMNQNLLNNQQFRSLRNERMYKTECKKGIFYRIGDADGGPAETRWLVVARGYSKSGGPYQWFRMYNMCPKNLLELDNACTQGVDEGKCQPECQKWQQIMETSLAADTGFYYKFESDPVTGKPSGCPGLDKEWPDGRGFNAGTKAVVNDCEKEDYAPEGEPLYAIIDDYAQDQQKWFDDFVVVVTKMSANGYQTLTTNDFDFNQYL